MTTRLILTCLPTADFLKSELLDSKPQNGNETSTWATIAAHGKSKGNVRACQRADKGNSFKLFRQNDDSDDGEDSGHGQDGNAPSLTARAASLDPPSPGSDDFNNERDSVSGLSESASQSLFDGASEEAVSVASEVRWTGSFGRDFPSTYADTCSAPDTLRVGPSRSDSY